MFIGERKAPKAVKIFLLSKCSEKYTMRLLHEVQNLVVQGGAAKIKCNKHLILKDRENHIFLDPLLCRARDGSCKALKVK
uniref:Uncharacterized protein n=1 Tax=Candidatus Kentrum sp. UNK TaxID=2126344 RepID=A0A451ATE7_9GAMM|nr:MAG: hypothetical protein BECKUNK1418G_GA0071005_13581 [Candidatus Kentron sp. UNK]VFK73880.1 MAG: hypothetical protein BECKUNK1418H_GA0071006_13411 [Candidatus Kentron sp. UNK]